MIATVIELDHCLFHMEFHNILQGFELWLSCLPPQSDFIDNFYGPTGRAAKRMSEATDHEAKTIHRMLEYSIQKGGF